MATSGHFINEFRTGLALRAEWRIVSQNIANNQSTLHVELFLVSLGDGYTITSQYSKKAYITIDDATLEETIPNAALSANEKRLIAGYIVPVLHDASGNASVKIKCQLKLQTTIAGTYYDRVYVPAAGNGVAVLDTIQRGTIPNTSGAMIVGNTIKIALPRLVNHYVHDVAYSLNGSDWVDIADDAPDATTWTLPEELATAKPNAASGTVYIRAKTYSPNMGVYIGEQQITRTYNITAEYAAPSVELSAAQTNAADIDGYIKGRSTVTLSAAATFQYGARAAKYVFTYGGETKTIMSANAAEAVSFTLPANAENPFVCSVTVTDSRGHTATSNITFATIDYSAPELANFAVLRGDYEDDVFAENPKGRNLQIVCDYAITSLGGANTKRYTIEYRLANDTTYTELIPETALAAYSGTIAEYTDAIFSQNIAYVLRIKFIDEFDVVSSILDVPSQRVLLNFSANGKAVAIGGIANTDDALEIMMQLYATGGMKPMQLADGADFDELTKTGVYVGDAASGNYSNMPVNTGSFILDVSSAGMGGQLMQRFSHCDKTAYRAYVRLFDADGWCAWEHAEGFADYAASNHAGYIRLANGFMMQWGRVAIVPDAANATKSVDITYPLPFTQTPIVQAHAQTSIPAIVHVAADAGNRNGTTLYLHRANTIATFVSWVAIGRGAS